MKKILLIIFLLPFVGFGQVTGDYRSSFTTGNTGSWTSLSSWQYYNGSSWVTPTTYPGQNTGTGTVTIRDSHIITINTNITNSFTSLVIGSGTSGELVVNSDITVNTTSVSIMSNGTMSFASNKSITFPANSSFSISSGGRLYASNSNCSNQTALYIGSTKVSACTGNGGGALSNFDSFNSGGGTGRATSNTPVCAGNQLVLTAVSPVATSGSYTYTYRWSGPGIYYNPDFSSSATYTINDVNIYNHGGNYIVEIKRNDGFISSVSTNVVVNPALITPTNLRPENVTPCASTVKWDGSATKFYLDVATNDTFSAGTILPAYNNLDVGNINSVNLTGLSPNTIYYFRVRASGGCGFSPYSKGNFTTLSIDVPRNVRSEHVNWCTSTIMWDGSATKYFLDVATSNTFSAGTILPAYNNLELGNVNSLILSGLSPNTMYHFRLRRLESCGLSGNSTVNSFTTMTIASPVADPGSGSCNNWVAQWHGVYNVSGQEVDGYYLDVAIDNNFTNYVSGYQSLYVDKASNRNYTITGLSPGGVYYYRLRAKTTCGTGTNSNVITFTEKGNNSSTPGTIGGGDSSICVGNTTTFTKDPNSWPSTGTWSIFNQTGSATITQGGVVTGVSPGTVLVVFSTYNGCYTSSSKSLTINGATFTTVPSSPICSNVDATYTTQSGKSNYVWTISGSLGTDYTISAGGTTTNSVTLKWLTGGPKTVSVNYSGGCSGVGATNTITVNKTSAPTGTGSQSFCSGATVSNLTTTGTGIQWYTTASGGTALFNSTVLTNGTHYYASQTVSGCESTSRLDVVVTINPTPANPTFGTITNANCVTSTGSIVLNGLPPSGSWTINQTGHVPESYNGSGPSYEVKGLAVGTYTFTVTNSSGCPSPPTAPQSIISEPSTTWDGSGWSNGVPTVLKAIIFDGNYTSNGDLEGCSCQVNTGKNVIFKSVGTNSGHTLKVTNGVTVVGTGTLTFENNASLVQTKDAAENVNINSGNINYKRHTNYVRRYDFTYWSSPVAGQTLYNLSPTTLGDKFYGFNSAGNNWTIYYNGNQEMLPGEGYLIRAPQTFDITTAAIDTSPEFKGKPNNGIITKNLDAGKLYLLGNPYPSALDADEFLYTNKDVLDGTLYFWTHNTAIQLATNITNGTAGSGVYAYTSDDYASYNRTGGISTAVSAISDPKHSVSGVDLGLKPTGKIAAGQGFFAPASTIGGKLIFNNGMRASGSGDNSQFFKLSTTSKTTIQKDRVWLNLTNKEGAFKQTLIGYITGATNDYDGGFDAVTYDANPFVDFYSVNNEVNLVIQGRALPFVKKDSVSLGYKSAIKGEFQISIDLTDGALATQKIFLEDQDLKVLHDLKKEPYTFNTEKGVFNNRFVLRYVDKNAIEVELSKEVIVSVLDKKITINSALTTIDKVVLYDMTGRKLFQKNKADANVFVIPNFVWNHQVLVVDIVLSDGTKHTRKVVN